jgi:hypothetical protein
MSLENIELARLNRAGLLRKEAREVMDELVDAVVEARLSRWLLNCRREDSVRRAREDNNLALLSPGPSAQPLGDSHGGSCCEPSAPEQDAQSMPRAKLLAGADQPARLAATQQPKLTAVVPPTSYLSASLRQGLRLPALHKGSSSVQLSLFDAANRARPAGRMAAISRQELSSRAHQAPQERPGLSRAPGFASTRALKASAVLIP